MELTRVQGSIIDKMKETGEPLKAVSVNQTVSRLTTIYRVGSHKIHPRTAASLIASGLLEFEKEERYTTKYYRLREG